MLRRRRFAEARAYGGVKHLRSERDQHDFEKLPDRLNGGQRCRLFALEWFTQMQAGRLDRACLTDVYNAQLTDDAVPAMSRHLNEYTWSAAEAGAEILHRPHNR